MRWVKGGIPLMQLQHFDFDPGLGDLAAGILGWSRSDFDAIYPLDAEVTVLRPS